MAGEHQHPPLLRDIPVDLAEGAVQRLRLLLLQEPLAVGRVGHHLAVLPGAAELCHIGLLETDAVLHAGLPGVVPGNGDGLRVDIAAPDVVLPVKLPILRLLRRVHPDGGGNRFPLLGVKAPVQARGPVLGDESGLDGDGAAAAEGVPEGVLAPVAAEGHHGRGQGLPQGRLHAHCPVAPLVESRPRGVQVQGQLVAVEGKLDLILLPGLRQGLQAVFLPQAGGRRLFDHGLAGGDGVELGAEAVALYRELAVPGDIVLPGHRLHTLEELLKGPHRVPSHQEQHPLAAAQVEVQPGQLPQVPLAQHPAGLRPDLLQAQLSDFVCHQALQAEEAGHGKCGHCVLSLVISCPPV